MIGTCAGHEWVQVSFGIDISKYEIIPKLGLMLGHKVYHFIGPLLKVEKIAPVLNTDAFAVCD